MSHPTYPHLLEPLTLGAGPDALTLRNRVVMGSMHTGLEDHPWDIDKLSAFFAGALLQPDGTPTNLPTKENT